MKFENRQNDGLGSSSVNTASFLICCYNMVDNIKPSFHLSSIRN